MQIKVRIDDSALKRVMNGFNPKVATQIMRKTIAEATKVAKSETVRIIGDVYDLAPAKIKQGIKSYAPNVSRLQGSVTVFPKPIGLELFKPQQASRGLIATVFKRQGAKLLPGTFMAKMKSGKKQAMIRTRRITAAVKPFVIKPSPKPVRRTSKGSELPINRLFADPATIIVGPATEKIVEAAQLAAVEKLSFLTEQALDTGKV